MRRASVRRVGEATVAYAPRDPAQSALYQVVRDHFETFRAEAGSLRDGEGLRDSWSANSGSSSRVGASRRDSRAFTATRAATIAWSRSRARDAAFA